jgi:serine/threonine protein phosphatase PrpC
MNSIKILSACVQGASHKHKNTECQDSFKIFSTDNLAVVAVADGHGSEACKHSKVGAEIAVNVFHSVMQKYYGSRYDLSGLALMADLRREKINLARSIDVEWKRRVERSHREPRKNRDIPLTESGGVDRQQIWRMHGTTLLGLVLTREFYFAFQLGDGDILLLHDGKTRNAVKTERILGVETYSLSCENAWEKAVTSIGSMRRETGTLFMLATDGFSNSYSSEEKFHQTCLDYYDVVKEYGGAVVQANLREWLDETSVKGSGDDITVCFTGFGMNW